jgi:imidazole glycerol-phosphate synthase subunit HisH
MRISSPPTLSNKNKNNNNNNNNDQNMGANNAALTGVTPRIAIFDYGAGNLFSLKAALERNGARNVSVIQDLKSLSNYDGLVLPGVGNFDPAVKSIGKDKGFLVSAIDCKMPVLGICLGMEMLFNASEEGRMEGLKIIDGQVRLLDKKRVKVPHMGWNNIQLVRHKTRSENSIKKRHHVSGNNNNNNNDTSDGRGRLLRNIKDNSWVYFVHSYRIFPGRKSRRIVIANTRYGDNIIPAVIEKGNIFGTQFHPEKSGPVGSQIIRNFLEICMSITAVVDPTENK